MKPEKLERKRNSDALQEQRRMVIEETVSEMLKSNKPIVRAQQVKAKVEAMKGFEMSEKLIRQVMKKELRMGYRLAKTVPVQGNSERCLVLRQQYALKMLTLLESGRRIINVDESWLNQTRFIRKAWTPSDVPASFTEKQVAPRISLLTALDTEGRLYCALT